MRERILLEEPAWLLDLLSRSELAEGAEVECKLAGGGIPKDTWETVSAFANTRGGLILFGVEERDVFVVQGIANPDARRKELWDNLRNPQKVSSLVLEDEAVTVETVDGAPLLVLRVSPASRVDRPVYINGNPYLGTYVRRHSGDYRCTRSEVDRMIREASGEAADTRILEGFSIEDLDRQAISGYRQRFLTRDPTSPKNELDDHAFLRSIGAIGKDRTRGIESITVAGLLMFGADEAIRDWRGRHLIDFRLLPETVGDFDRWTDRVVWEGHLYGAFFTLYPRVTDSLPTPFELQDQVRSGDSAVHVALREALVNLLVHADYSEGEASLILRSPEGFLFRNPGTSRVSEDDMLIGNRSDPRNPLLAAMFRYIGLAEEAGTGIPKIVQLWRLLGFQLPDIHQGTERYEFSIELRYAHLVSIADRKWLHQLGDAWAEEEQLALVLAKHEGTVDNRRLRSMAGLHPADATAVLGRLRHKGFLEVRGGGPRTWYQLPSDLRDHTGVEPAPVHEHEITEEQWSKLLNIAAPVRDGLTQGKRPPRTLRNTTAVALCSETPLTLEELAQLLGYTKTGVRGIVQELVRDGLLQYRHPERPTHPHQRYVALKSL